MLELFDRRWGGCKLCRLLRNPHYAPASYLARVCVNLATFMWAAIVLLREGGIDAQRWFIYRLLMQFAPEEYWAFGALVLVTIGLYRLLAGSTPRWWGSIGYIGMMAFWLYLSASLFTNPFVREDPASPAATAAILVTTFLSIFAAASNARAPSEPL